MIVSYDVGLPATPGPEAAPGRLCDAGWVDMLRPTPEEEERVEADLGIDVPTREDLGRIEPSSRLYREGGATFLTASVVCRSQTDAPETTDVAFVLTAGPLVTIRYADLRAFDLFAARMIRQPPTRGGLPILIDLLEAIVDRTSEILERASREADEVPVGLFPPGGDRRRRRTVAELENNLGEIEGLQRLVAKVRESLVSLGRLLGFLLAAEDIPFDAELRARAKSMARDVASLSDHATYVSGNIGFLLDASLGLISIEQNAIIKFFSIVAVVMLPPTLIGTVYGMNFAHMPELDWRLGYPLALLLMIVSAVLPYLWFRRRGWI